MCEFKLEIKSVILLELCSLWNIKFTARVSRGCGRYEPVSPGQGDIQLSRELIKRPPKHDARLDLPKIGIASTWKVFG